MKTHEFGKSDTVLIQPVGKHELSWIENEVMEIHRLTSADFKYIAVEIDDWNDDLSPWKAPAVFTDGGFGGGAVKTLEKILMLCSDKKKYYIGGTVFPMGSIPNRCVYRNCCCISVRMVSWIY